MDHKVIEAISQLNGEKAVLATIVSTKGSTPRKAGAQVLFFQDGRTIGTIGGGCGEAEARGHALNALHKQEPLLIQVDLTHEIAEQDGMVCGGTMDIFLEPLLGF
ncbi:XdhC family protein [Desulfitobacterium sp. THU1]|uniref:XdhC family protein n=1 Tax=Desulfitobacterium sp. THU1 TaxID=3138072 RepID=UPI00311D4C03